MVDIALYNEDLSSGIGRIGDASVDLAAGFSAGLGDHDFNPVRLRVPCDGQTVNVRPSSVVVGRKRLQAEGTAVSWARNSAVAGLRRRRQ